MEITQFTYFQECGGFPCNPIPVEITYGLERIAMFIQKVDSVYDIKWNDTVKYGDIYLRQEQEHSSQQEHQYLTNLEIQRHCLL